MNLTEKYRPASFDAVIGQEKAVGVIQRLKANNSLGGRAFDITGKSGTGKTTIARLIARQIAEPLYIQEVVARQETPATIREWFNSTRYTTIFGKPGHARIVNERHGLRRDCVEVYLDVLESLPETAVVIFTTTLEADTLFDDAHVDSGPFKSRCMAIQLTTQGLAPKLAQRALEIARIEGLDGKPLNAYKELVNQCRSNMREVIQNIEAGRMLS